MPSKVVKIEDDRDMVSDSETLHCTSNGGNLGGCVGTGNTMFLDSHRVTSVQHGDIAEVKRDGMNLDKHIVRSEFFG
jgi:hypothetical protein